MEQSFSLIDLFIANKNFTSKLAFYQDQNSTYTREEFWKKAKKTTMGEIPQTRFVAINCQNDINDFIRVVSLWLQGLVPVLFGDYLTEKTKQELLSVHQISMGQFEESEEMKIDSLKIHQNWDEACLVILTSGTTGTPKPIVLSFRNIFSKAQEVIECYEAKAGDRWGLELPTSHIGGMSLFFRATLGGLTVVKDETSHLDFLSLVPAQLTTKIENKTYDSLRSLKAIMLGGSSCPPSLLKRAQDLHIPLSPTYGMTEMSSTVAIMSVSEFLNFDLTKPLELTLLNGHEAFVDENSTLFLSGPSQSIGHLISGNFFKSEGPLKTQDLAQIRHNKLIILGRSDRTIISGGMNISLEGVKKVLLDSNLINYCELYPVSDIKFGEVLELFVRLKKDITSQELLTFMDEHLSKHQKPKFIYYLDDSFDTKKTSKALLENFKSKKMHLHFLNHFNPKKKNLIFLHGFMGSGLDWIEFKDSLDEFNIIAPDLPGHGKSNALTFPDFQACSQFVFSNLKEFLPHSTIAGYSMGGRMAMALAASSQKQNIPLRGLVLLSANPGLATIEEKRIRQKWEENLLNDVVDKKCTFEEFLTNWYQQPLFKGMNKEQLKKTLTQKLEQSPLDLKKSFLSMGLSTQPNFTELFNSPPFPVCFITGQKDEKYQNMANQLESRFKAVQFISVKNGLHNWQVEYPEFLIQSIKNL